MQQVYCGNLMESLITVHRASLSWEPHRLFPGPGILMFVDRFFVAHLESVRLNLHLSADQ